MARRGGLTAIAVENLKAKDVRYEVPDPGCAGLYLQIHPGGAKSWAYRFRFAGKSYGKLTIGTAYTDKGVEVIKIGAARDIADEARVMVAKRIDPAEVKKDQRKKAAEEATAAENTLKAIAETYLEQPEHKRSARLRIVGRSLSGSFPGARPPADRKHQAVRNCRHARWDRQDERPGHERLCAGDGAPPAGLARREVRRLRQPHRARHGADLHQGAGAQAHAVRY